MCWASNYVFITDLSLTFSGFVILNSCHCKISCALSVNVNSQMLQDCSKWLVLLWDLCEVVDVGIFVIRVSFLYASHPTTTTSMSLICSSVCIKNNLLMFRHYRCIKFHVCRHQHVHTVQAYVHICAFVCTDTQLTVSALGVWSNGSRVIKEKASLTHLWPPAITLPPITQCSGIWIR